HGGARHRRARRRGREPDLERAERAARQWREPADHARRLEPRGRRSIRRQRAAGPAVAQHPDRAESDLESTRRYARQRRNPADDTDLVDGGRHRRFWQRAKRHSMAQCQRPEPALDHSGRSARRRREPADDTDLMERSRDWGFHRQRHRRHPVAGCPRREPDLEHSKQSAGRRYEPANHADFLEYRGRWREQRRLGPFQWARRRSGAASAGDGKLRAGWQQRRCKSDPPADFRSKLAAVLVKPAALICTLMSRSVWRSASESREAAMAAFAKELAARSSGDPMQSRKADNRSTNFPTIE